MRARPRPGRRRAPRSSRDEPPRRCERLGDAVRVAASGFGERWLAAASAADVLAELAGDLHGVEAPGDERLAEVDHQEDASVVPGGDDRAFGLLLLADAVGEVPQRPAPQAPDLDEDDIPLPLLEEHLRLLGLARPAGAGARPSELGPQPVGFAGPLVQEREGLARGDGLD